MKKYDYVENVECYKISIQTHENWFHHTYRHILRNEPTATEIQNAYNAYDKRKREPNFRCVITVRKLTIEKTESRQIVDAGFTIIDTIYSRKVPKSDHETDEIIDKIYDNLSDITNLFST